MFLQFFGARQHVFQNRAIIYKFHFRNIKMKDFITDNEVLIKTLERDVI